MTLREQYPHTLLFQKYLNLDTIFRISVKRGNKDINWNLFTAEERIIKETGECISVVWKNCTTRFIKSQVKDIEIKAEKEGEE